MEHVQKRLTLALVFCQDRFEFNDIFLGRAVSRHLDMDLLDLGFRHSVERYNLIGNNLTPLLIDIECTAHQHRLLGVDFGFMPPIGLRPHNDLNTPGLVLQGIGRVAVSFFVILEFQ